MFKKLPDTRKGVCCLKRSCKTRSGKLYTFWFCLKPWQSVNGPGLVAKITNIHQVALWARQWHHTLCFLATQDCHVYTTNVAGGKNNFALVSPVVKLCIRGCSRCTHFLEGFLTPPCLPWQLLGAGWRYTVPCSLPGTVQPATARCWAGCRYRHWPGICHQGTTWGRTPPDCGQTRSPHDAWPLGHHDCEWGRCETHCNTKRCAGVILLRVHTQKSREQNPCWLVPHGATTFNCKCKISTVC